MTIATTTQDAIGTLATGERVRVIDLGQPLFTGIPSSPSHPGYRHSLLRRHGDAVREDGTSGANDLLVLGTHTGTHIDALAHISHDGLLHGGANARSAQEGGGFDELGAHRIAPTLCPGVLLDVPAARGVDLLEPGTPLSADDLEATARRQGTRIAQGDAVLVRTGWGALWGDPHAFLSHDGGVPGPDESGARWLADHGAALVGSDTTAFEHIPAGIGHARLPGHRVLLVESGIPIIEMLALENLSRSGVHEFTFVLLPLPLVGATGSPVRPVALVHDGGLAR